jgi:L-serine dehydratase
LPHSIDLNGIPERLARINNSGSLHLPDGHALPFEVARDLVVRMDESLPKHPNGLRFHRLCNRRPEECVYREVYYSVGGGFIVTDADIRPGHDAHPTPKCLIPFSNGTELFAQCRREQLNLSVAELVLANEMPR